VNNELTPKQQTSEAIRQAETILITTGSHPSVDQVAAVIALAAILRKFGKKVSAIISDPLPAAAQFLDASGLDKGLTGQRDFVLKVDVTKTEVDKLRYEVEGNKLNVYITPFKGGFAPSDVTFGYGDYQVDIAIVLGVASRSRIDRIYTDQANLFGSIPVLNIDFHRTNESFGAVNLIEPTASSLCEILVALSESLQSGLIDSDIATVMLAGLMASTDRFTAVHTTSKSLTVAAQLMAAGAKQQQVVKGLYQRSDRPERGSERSERPRNEQPRNDRPAQPTRSAAPQPERRSEQPAQPAAERPQPATAPAPVETEAPAPRPERETPPATPAPADHHAPSAVLRNPDAELMEAPGTLEDEDAVIQPNHIEPSQFEPGDEAPQATEFTEPGVPMADFAAAAEILRQRHEAGSDRTES
jgi:nanoRNase/pAp phosphatase (c-di-AMP/oligoRNAs hydrolase)